MKFFLPFSSFETQVSPCLNSLVVSWTVNAQKLHFISIVTSQMYIKKLEKNYKIEFRFVEEENDQQSSSSLRMSLN